MLHLCPLVVEAGTAWMTTQLFSLLCRGKLFLTSSGSCPSYIYHVRLCAQLFRFKTCFLWCKIQLSIYFPIDGFLLCLDFFPSSHDKQSAFLIRLGKHKTSGWLHLRKGNLHFNKIPSSGQRRTGGRQPAFAIPPHRWCCISVSLPHTHTQTCTGTHTYLEKFIM